MGDTGAPLPARTDQGAGDGAGARVCVGRGPLERRGGVPADGRAGPARGLDLLPSRPGAVVRRAVPRDDRARRRRRTRRSIMKRILLAYDGGEPAWHALETAAQLAKRFDASI